MIASLTNQAVVVAVASANDYNAPLHPRELKYVARAATKRRSDFTAGRACARRALSELGHPAVAVETGSRGQPLWPPEVVGSITHTDGYCAAAVARARACRAIGIDAERRRPLDTRTVAHFLTAVERARVPCLDGEPIPILPFSAKESFYKLWSTVVGSRLDYLDAEISFDLPAGRFSVDVVAGQPVPELLDCRFAVTRSHVFTTVTLPLPAP